MKADFGENELPYMLGEAVNEERYLGWLSLLCKTSYLRDWCFLLEDLHTPLSLTSGCIRLQAA